MEKREKFWNVPNTMTVVRTAIAVPAMLLLPFFGGTPERHLGSQIIGWVVIFTAIADSLDGSLARALGQMTKYGKLLDPIADKAINCTAFIVLVALGRIPMWAVWLVAATLIRELAVSGLRASAGENGLRIMESSALGKTKTVFQDIAIIGITMYYPCWYGWLRVYEIGMTALVVSTGLAVYSGYLYGVQYFRMMAAKSEGPKLRAVS